MSPTTLGSVPAFRRCTGSRFFLQSQDDKKQSGSYFARLDPWDATQDEQITQFFIFTLIPGEMIQFDEYFPNGLKPPSRTASTDPVQKNCYVATVLTAFSTLFNNALTKS